MGQQQQNNPKPRARNRRRPIHRALRLLTVVIVGLLGVAIIGHTIIIREVAEGTLAKQVGCGVNIGSARIGPGGSIVLRRVRLRAPGVTGQGGVFLESASVKAEIDWVTLLTGGQGVRRMQLVDPIVRLSQDAESGALNLLRVGGSPTGKSPGTTRSITPLPEVEFIDGRVEFGEHDGRSYTVLAKIPVKGHVRVPASSMPEYEIELTEKIIGQKSRPPMQLTGDFNVEALTGELRLVDLDLDHWQGWQAPIEARDLWKELDIRGRISEASFTANRDSSVTAWFTLDGVRLTAPIRAPGMDASEIRASDVDGVIRFTPEGLSAELVGVIEDLPARIEFQTDGLRINAPLTCTITTDRFLVSENPGMLRFVPKKARELFDEFGGPTGEVSGYVTLSRGSPLGGEPAPIIASGQLQIVNGRGEHEIFPYPVGSLTGAIRFDEHEIELIDIRGVSHNGARLIATGTIAPPAEGTDVHIELNLSAIPTDDALVRAMPARARRVLRTLIHEPALSELRDRGLLLTSADHDTLVQRRLLIEEELELHKPGGDGSAVRRIELLREIELIEDRLRTPLFDLGGLAQAHVLIERNGLADVLHTTIDIRVDRAGLLPEPFPYPFIATDFHVVVKSDGVMATAERLDGLTGARAGLLAVITYPDSATGEPGATLIDIDLKEGPVDALLLAAIPAPGDAGAENLFDAIGDLSVAGRLVGSIVIDSTLPDDFRAELSLEHLRLTLPSPDDGEQPPLEASGLQGDVTVTNSRVDVGPIVGAFQGSPVTVQGLWQEAEPGADPSPIRAEIKLDRFDLATRIDPVIALLGEGVATRWATMRDTHSIAGALDLTTSIELTPGHSPVVRTSLRNIRDLSFVAYGNAIEIDHLSGEIIADTQRIRMLNCTGAAHIDGRLSGLFEANGALALRELGEINLDLSLNDFGFDTPLLEQFLGVEDSPGPLQQWLQDRDLQGRADLRLSVLRGVDEPISWSIDAAPKELRLQSSDGPLHLYGAGKHTTIHADRGEIGLITLEGDGLLVNLSGNWRLGERAAIDLDFTMEGERLTPQMRALFPDDVRDLLSSLEIGIDSAWRLTHGEYHWRTDAQRFAGEGEFMGLRCNPGITITGADGRVVMRIERSEELSDPQIEFQITTEQMRLAGIRMTDGDLSLRTTDLPGRLVIDPLTANAHGGRVTGVVTIDTTTPGDVLATDGAEEGVWYEAFFNLAGIEVDSLLNNTAEIANGDTASDDNARMPFEGFTGRFDGALAIAGEVGDDRSRRGRGVFRIEGGELLMAPLMVPIIELSNLRAPSGEGLEHADAEVYLHGSLVHIEELRISSDSISIIGDGDVAWPGLDLNMKFNSRSNYRVPILSDLIEGLRNEFITTIVTGTLLDPEFRTRAFPGTVQTLDELFGGKRSRSGNDSSLIQRSEGAEGVSSVLPTRPPDSP